MFRYHLKIGMFVWLFALLGASSAYAAIKRDLRFDGTTSVSGTGTLGSGSTLSVKYGIYYYCIDDLAIGSIPCTNSSNYTKNFQVQFNVCEGDGTTCSTVKTVTNSYNWIFTSDKQSYTESITLPNTVKNGTRWVQVVLDSSGIVSETNENNNSQTASFSVGEKPDLTIKTLTVSPTSAKAGDSVTVTYEFCNDGKAASSVSAKFRFYYSADSTITTGDTYLNQEVSASLNAGACTGSATKSVTIPASATANPSYIGVIADYDAKEAEANENNNTKSVSVALNAVDLTIKIFQLSTTTVQKGLAFTANYQVCNSGVTDMTTAATFRFYYSTDATVDTNDKYLNQQFTATLKAGVCHPATGTNAVSLTLPTTEAFGTFYVGLIADYDKKIAESNENNNVSSIKITFKDRDEDEDGVPADIDCDDKDKTSYPRYNNNPAGTEVCDGKDNDCNGTIDDIADLGKACTDTSRKGVCQAGTWACVNKVKTCKQTTQSSSEICDGKDNNCDGMIDNGINCSEPTSEPTAETVSEPTKEAVSEPTKEAVSEPTSEPVSEPAREPVQDTASSDGGTTQEAGTSDGGVSDTTTSEGSGSEGSSSDNAPGDTSSSGSCSNVTCNAGEFCRGGQCYKACGCTKCDKGKSCKDGACVNDPCGGITCPQGQACEASSGQCIKDLCDGVSCNKDEICMEGSCQKDPCGDVTCYNNQVCYHGQCYDDGCQPNRPQEPVTEAASEATAEPAEESIITDASTPESPSDDRDTPTEPTTEGSSTTDASSQDSPSNDTATSTESTTQDTIGTADTIGGSGQEATTDTATTGGCGCQAQTLSIPAMLAGLLLLLLFLGRNPRRQS